MTASFTAGVASGMTLLKTVSTAVVELSQCGNLGSFTLPYPHEAQRALDRTVLACMWRQAQPPLSVPDLIAWCQDRPIAQWPIDLPDGLVDDDDRLVDPHTREPSRLCYEWAVDRPDSATEQFDRELMYAAIERSRHAQSPAAYREFRRILILRPAMTRDKAAELSLDPVLTPLDGLLQQIYLPAPAGWAEDGRFVLCGRCKTLLIPTRDRDWVCENDKCRKLGLNFGPSIGVDDGDGMLLLTRPLRLFVTEPGRAELKLDRALRRLGLTPELWPDFDAYDLRITFPDGQVWAVDVKDWASPVLLGRQARPLRRQPEYDRGFIVVPQHRLRRRNYLTIVRENMPAGIGNQIGVAGEHAFIAQARKHLADCGHSIPDVSTDIEDDDA